MQKRQNPFSRKRIVHQNQVTFTCHDKLTLSFLSHTNEGESIPDAELAPSSGPIAARSRVTGIYLGFHIKQSQRLQKPRQNFQEFLNPFPGSFLVAGRCNGKRTSGVEPTSLEPQKKASSATYWPIGPPFTKLRGKKQDSLFRFRLPPLLWVCPIFSLCSRITFQLPKYSWTLI